MVLARAWRSRRGTGKIEDGGGWMDGWVGDWIWRLRSSVEASEKERTVPADRDWRRLRMSCFP